MCQVYFDGDLLLHAHGELRGWKKLKTQGHLLVCRHCRTRYHQMVSVSVLLWGTVRSEPWTVVKQMLDDDDLHPWKLGKPKTIGAIVGLVLIISILVIGLTQSSASTNSGYASRSSTAYAVKSKLRENLDPTRCDKKKTKIGARQIF